MTQSLAFPTTLYLVPGALQALSDVSVNPGLPQDGYPLIWNNTTGKWQAEQVAYSNLSGAPTLGTIAAQNYQSSTYTPVVASTDVGQYGGWSTEGFTLNIQSGRFTVIGNICICFFWVGLSAKPSDLSSNRWVWVSLPFAGTSGVNIFQWTPTVTAYSSTFTQGLTEAGPAGPWALIFKANPLTVATLADLTGGDRMLATITYFIDV